MTSGQQTSLFTEDRSIFSPGDSLANPTAQQGNEREKKMTATSGRKCLEQFERFNRPGLWARMFAASLIGMGDWYSTKCRLIWKLKATKSHRFYFQLVPSMLPTEETGYGLLLTPRATTISETQEQFAARMNSRRKNDRKNGFPNLEAQIKGLLPTPQTQGLKVCDQEGKTQFMDLHLLPTMGGCKNDRGKSNLEEVTGTGSQLSPRFVGEMMGFPPTHTLEPFETKMQWIEL